MADVFAQHIQDIHAAMEKENTSYGGDYNMLEIFASLQPHFALRSNPNEEHYLRMIVDFMCRLLLPSYEYSCDAVKYLLRGALVVNIKKMVDLMSEPGVIIASLVQVFFSLFSGFHKEFRKRFSKEIGESDFIYFK